MSVIYFRMGSENAGYRLESVIGDTLATVDGTIVWL